MIFLDVARIAALLGFTGTAEASAGIVQVLFVVFLVLFIGSLIFAFGIIGRVRETFRHQRKPREKRYGYGQGR